MFERAAAYRPGAKGDLASVTTLSLRLVARPGVALDAEVAELDALLEPFWPRSHPELLAVMDLGTDTASALLVAAGTTQRSRQ